MDNHHKSNMDTRPNSWYDMDSRYSTPGGLFGTDHDTGYHYTGQYIACVLDYTTVRALMLMIQRVTIRVGWSLWRTSLSSDSLELICLFDNHFKHCILTVTKISDGKSFISSVIISKIQILDVIKPE